MGNPIQALHCMLSTRARNNLALRFLCLPRVSHIQQLNDWLVFLSQFIEPTITKTCYQQVLLERMSFRINCFTQGTYISTRLAHWWTSLYNSKCSFCKFVSISIASSVTRNELLYNTCCAKTWRRTEDTQSTSSCSMLMIFQIFYVIALKLLLPRYLHGIMGERSTFT